MVDPGTDLPVDQQVTTLLTDAMTLFEEADAALRAGDLGTYQSKNKAATAKAEEALALLNG